MKGKDPANTPWLLIKRVLPQRTDNAGVMWHGAYFLWLEEARVEALLNVGVLYSELSKEGFELPVVNLKINYCKSLFHGDEVTLKSWVLPRKGARWPWQTKIFRANGDLAAEALVELVLLRTVESEKSLLRTPPDHLQEAFAYLQKGP